MIGSRGLPAGKEGSNATTLENRSQRPKIENVQRKTDTDPKPPVMIFNNSKKGHDSRSKTPVYVPPAKRKQEVRFVDEPTMVPELTDEEMERILDQPAVLPRQYSAKPGYMPEIVELGEDEEDLGFTVPEVDDSDRTLEKAWEEADALKNKSSVKVSTPTRSPTQNMGRPYDSVQPLKIKPIPMNTPRPGEQAKSGEVKAKEPQYQV